MAGAAVAGAAATVAPLFSAAASAASYVMAPAKTPSPPPRNKEVTLKDIKRLLSDENRMKALEAFKERCGEARKKAVRDRGETKTVFIIRECPDNLQLLPGTIIVGRSFAL